MLELVRRPGRRSWYVRGTVLGKSVYASCRTDDHAKAAQFADALGARLWERGLDPRRDTVTFADAARTYLVGKAPRDKDHVEAIVAVIGGRPVNALGQADVDALVGLLAAGRSPASQNRTIYTPVAAVLHWAAERGWCPHPRLRRPRIDATPRDRVLTPDEASRVLAALPGPAARACVLVMLYTGARVGEAVALRWEDVDLGRRHLSLYEFKTRKRRGVALRHELVVALANLERREDGRVFPWEHANGFRQAWRKAVKKAGIPLATPHACRHTYATWLRQGGADQRAVMVAGGWKDPKSVARYQHVTAEEVRVMVDRLPNVGQRGPSR